MRQLLLCRKWAGIPKVRFHDHRHTFATIALQNSVDIKTVSGMLGNFSAGFTVDIKIPYEQLNKSKQFDYVY